jgi:hypothetical protein
MAVIAAMMPLAAAAGLAVLLAQSGEEGGSWTCTVKARMEAGNTAMLQSMVYVGGGGDLPSFFVQAMKESGSLDQEMAWYYLPRRTAELGKPDSIRFGLPAHKLDRKGHLLFLAEGRRWTLMQEPAFVRSVNSYSWVQLERWIERNEFWRGSGWRVEAYDRTNKLMGSTQIRLAAPDEVQGAYDRLKAELEGIEADPAKNCMYNPPPDPEAGVI